VHLINHRILHRDSRSSVALPFKCRIDHHRLRDTPRVITEILRQIFLLIADDITEHFIGPAHFSGDGFRVGVEKEF
jgi:hypothetical protein